ncbi:extracellular solute-binding protein [Halopelagius longus]|uniref:Carbohydrate ABC transporter substrate-binding protein, CUT1 family n=1 Tax=Halopelagius longus TaxID=1236180 RepID=A0A1H1FJX0_9EURY|nr:extracellular solute-binding protein [Halopelagius longus]RDI70060.1 extracellular solute-binding protein [Halopelagius longus]SDR01373.1 carbohydrate ABC transporter substrate-binding protein, CUT1 family [Halopelagius longus]
MSSNGASDRKGERTVRRAISRRRFVAAAGATGVTAGFAGCSSSGGEGTTGGTAGGGGGGSTTLQLSAHSEWRNQSEKVKQALYDAGLSEDIGLEFVSAGSTTDEMQSQYNQWLSAGQAKPDLLVFDSGWTIPFIIREQLLNLEQELPQDLLDTVHNDYFQESVRSATGPNGDLYGVPLYPDFPTIQYRKDLVQDAGYDWQQYATDPMSWEQFSNELADVHEQSDAKYGFNWQAASEIQLACCVFNEFLSSWGGAYFGNPKENLYGPVGDRPITVTEEPVLQSLRMARTFIHGSDAQDTLDGFAGGITSQEASQWGLSPSMRPFTQGNAVALRNWPYSININGADDALGEDMGVIPLPYGVPEGEGKYPGTGGSIGALGGWNFSVNPNTENLEASIQFLQALSTESFQRANFEISGHLPPVPDVLQSSTDVPIMGRYLEPLTYAGKNTMARPATPVWPQQSDAVAQEAHSAIVDDKPVTEAMNRLQTRLKEFESSYSGS